MWCTFQKSIWRNFKEFWWSTLWTKRWVRLKRKKAETATQSIQIHQSPNKTLIHRKVSFLSRDYNFDLLICSQSLIWETSLKSLVLTKLLQKIRRKLPPAKQLISSRLPAKLIINTTKLLPNLTFRETVWNIFQIFGEGRIFSCWDLKPQEFILYYIQTFTAENWTCKTEHMMLWHTSRGEQKRNNVLQLFARAELWQERVGVEWNEKMGQPRGGWGVRNYFLGIHLSSSREIETQTAVETSKSNNTLTRLTLKGRYDDKYFL